MEINNNNFLTSSSIHQELSLKKSELASLDKKEFQKSTFEKKDETLAAENYDKNDYQRVIGKLEDRDSEVKMHEQIHASGGVATTAPINYNYQVGPDGKLYAVGGSVKLDTSVPNDPKEAEVKLDQIQDASSSVNSLSAADADIAQTASLNRMLLESMKEGFSYDNK